MAKLFSVLGSRFSVHWHVHCIHGPLLADSVEKVDFLELPKDWPEKPPFSTLLREISA